MTDRRRLRRIEWLKRCVEEVVHVSGVAPLADDDVAIVVDKDRAGLPGEVTVTVTVKSLGTRDVYRKNRETGAWEAAS